MGKYQQYCDLVVDVTSDLEAEYSEWVSTIYGKTEADAETAQLEQITVSAQRNQQ